MMTSQEIRQSFKNYFESKNHKFLPSAPIVIKNDPTLMFTNSGMNQFKDIILGNIPIQHSRIADFQKCLRINGKHNDIEEVGHDTYHHTMFEMLGNWSFDDYFKKEAIEYAWEYLTEIVKLDKDRLYVTVFGGSVNENLKKDLESTEYWRKYLPKSRIIDGSREHNFWEMGNIGPCGPCSEIHIDIRTNEERKKVDALTLINQNHSQVIEIWNLVFMQFNRKVDGSLESLPIKVIDTGMGFERLCMVVQGKISNYDTDLFQPLIHAIEKNTRMKYNQNAKISIAMRVIADHIRAITFAIADGLLPSNMKAGYVIRRILRRTIRYSYSFLEQKKPFIYELISFFINHMAEFYPELIDQTDIIEKIVEKEEKSFLSTLDKGIKILDKKIQEAKKNNEIIINGMDAFILYDTYGFPLDLTELILREQNMIVENTTFDLAMIKQKEMARKSIMVEITDWIILKEGETEFVGYDMTRIQARIIRYRKVKQSNVEFYQIILNKTPFFAEMGGQIGDIGQLIDFEGNSISVIKTKRENNLIIHFTKELPIIYLNNYFYAEINKEVRARIECNHTATHLLHEALRLVLGNHIVQKGSYISADMLRFDFSHFQKVTDKEIREIEKIVTKKIRQNFFLEETRQMSKQEALQLGAMSLFEEKYGEKVRVVKFGSSIEFCGGTHVMFTGCIGSFRVINESSVAAGIRRVEAITAEKVEDFFYDQQDVFRSLKKILNTSTTLYQSVQRLVEENICLKKQTKKIFKEKILELKYQIINNKQLTPNGINLFILKGSFHFEIVKELAFQIGGEYIKKCSFIAATFFEEKPFLALLISRDLVNNGLCAIQIIQKAAKKIQGNGGGQSHFATAGGKDIHGLPHALEWILDILSSV